MRTCIRKGSRFFRDYSDTIALKQLQHSQHLPRGAVTPMPDAVLQWGVCSGTGEDGAWEDTLRRVLSVLG